MKHLLSIVILALIIGACSSPPPTLSIPPTLPPGVTGAAPQTLLPTEPPTPAETTTPLPATATQSPTATPVPTEDAVPCPFTGLSVSRPVLESRRPILAQIGNSNPERPQFGLAQADLVFETIAEGGITRFSAIYLCQDAVDIAGVRSGRLIDLQLVPMFDAIFVHVGAS